MALDVQNLDELTDAAVEQAYEFATQFVQQKQANIETKRGVIADLLLGLDAILGAAHDTTSDRILASSSAKLINEDPTIADDTLVDNVVSNYRITRRAATYATGEVVIVLDEEVETTINSGAIFTVGDQLFSSDDTYTSRLTAGAVVADTDRLLVQVGVASWAFTINVTASEAGAASLLRKDALLIPASEPTAYVSAYASADFTGGLDAQTNTELMALQAAGMATKAYSNRDSTINMIRTADATVHTMVTEDFANILDISIIGMGDAEMDRDQHWLFPVSGGGRTDLYLHSKQLPSKIGLVRTATLVQAEVLGSTWQVTIARDDAPGFYEVDNIRLADATVGSADYVVSSDIRSMDLTGTDYIPDVLTVTEAAYSRFQTAIIQFLDTDTDISLLTPGVSTQDYEVTLVTMPLISEVQQFIGQRDIVNPCGDHLVKGAVPCFVTLDVEFDSDSTATEDVDEDAVAAALAAYVNTVGFTGRLYASGLSSAISALLPTGVCTHSISMTGRIRKPNAATINLTDTVSLIVTDLPADYVTARTTIFMLDPEDVTITTNDV